jgi:HSP20 family protein
MSTNENQITKKNEGRNEGRSLGFFDPLFDAFFPEERNSNHLMKTDIKENDGGYELAVEVPGLKKDQVSLKYSDGYLTIAAKESVSDDHTSKNGKFIRRERYLGSYERSFYVGEIDQKDIKAKMEDGILKVSFPKEKEHLPSENSIQIF